jgi:hypothetical protein
MFLLRKPTVLFALLAVFSMWSFHVKSSLILTLFKHIESSGNAMKLQQDLTSLEESDQQWQMKFHPVVVSYEALCQMSWRNLVE